MLDNYEADPNRTDQIGLYLVEQRVLTETGAQTRSLDVFRPTYRADL